MKSIASIAFILLFFEFSHGQRYTLEIVKSLNGSAEEAIYYYRNNWLKFRILAKEMGYISDYHLLFSEKDSTGNIEIALMTTYPDEKLIEESESNFRDLIQNSGSAGPDLMNDKKPGDFRTRLYLNYLKE